MGRKTDPKVIEYNQKMPMITEYLKMKHVPVEKRREIRAEVARRLDSDMAVDEQTVLGMMPGGLHGQLALK